MTKQEKLKCNKQLGLIWMQIRAYKNGSKGSEWADIQSKYHEFMETQEELCQTIVVAHPRLIDKVKELKYPNDIEKAITCLNTIVPSDQ